MIEKPLRVCIGVPSFDKHEPQFTRSLRNMENYRSFALMGDYLPVIERCGMSIEHARTEIVSEFLNHPWSTHLLFIDDDMVFDPDALDRLMRHGDDIIGGLCFARRQPYQPLLLKGRSEGKLGYLYNYRDSTLTEVDATGCGFLLIKRVVFENINKCYGEARWFERMGEMGEDYSFCRRAKVSGHRIFVDTGTKIGHVAKVVVTEEFAKLNRTRRIDEWNGES